jgi:hypothetical protein
VCLEQTKLALKNLVNDLLKHWLQMISALGCGIEMDLEVLDSLMRYDEFGAGHQSGVVQLTIGSSGKA